MPKRLAILAGAGELPRIAANACRKLDTDLVLYHFAEADLDVQLAADSTILRREVSLGKMAETFRFLQDDSISDIVLLGKIEKQVLLQDVSRDAAAEQIYQAATDRRDDTLFLQFAKAVSQMGINILPQKALLGDCFLPPGVHSKQKPASPALLEDIDFGYELSRKIGSLDIGQTAVVFEKMVLAVEAIEGTDAAIRRAGEIARGRGGVVCKTAKASQDPRFDLPAVGIRTLGTMHASGMQALVIESAQTLVVNPAQFVARADELRLILIAR
ncbi:MAG: LpxI family protein [Spirochaetota bacterium]